MNATPASSSSGGGGATGSGVPFYAWAAVLAVSSTVLGLQWDIAWHRSIGRDTFWSPPHLAIYLGGILAGLSSAYLILGTTLARSPASQQARAAAVRIWGLWGPLGAFVSAWGGVAMLASAPFDNWWHNSYGLDVTILSPPHTILGLGLVGIEVGGLILIAGARNRARGPARALLTALFLIAGGLLLVGLMTFELELTRPSRQHNAAFYRAVSLVAPMVIVGVGRASGQRFGSTLTAAVYSLVLLLLLWLFPLVPATPKLGPVYNPVTHLIPEGFPLLLLAPALAADLLMPALARRAPRWQALALGLLMLAAFMAVQWPLANFLLSTSAENWVFGSHYHDYNSNPAWASVHHSFRVTERSQPAFYLGLAVASAVSVLGARLGLAWASFLGQLRR